MCYIMETGDGRFVDWYAQHQSGGGAGAVRHSRRRIIAVHTASEVVDSAVYSPPATRGGINLDGDQITDVVKAESER